MIFLLASVIGEPGEDLEQTEDWQQLLISGPPSETLNVLCPEREKERVDQSENSMSDSEWLGDDQLE